ncbi:MAG: MoxR family ATPase [Armatimonadetes bacterium]|nr:MoxR family ATPase [Armatimonadota bacterium]
MAEPITDFANIRREMAKAVVGQIDVIDQILIALACEGHVLLEGVPGIAKTLIVRALSLAVSADFNRVQFTPDLMPSDVIGTSVFDPSKGAFNLRKGPIFTGLFLADEINRTPPKTQAALLEAMQERQVTIDGTTHALDPIFTVFATQNPIEYEGTYPLPEAQLDRFMFKVVVPYPAYETEVEMLSRYNAGFRSARLEDAGIQSAVDVQAVLGLRASVARVTVGQPIVEYVAKLVRKTRENRNLTLGASPRASIYLLLGSKAVAAMNGRDYVIPDDIKHIAAPVLRHRLILRPESEIEGLTPERIIETILAEVEVPRE